MGPWTLCCGTERKKLYEGGITNQVGLGYYLLNNNEVGLWIVSHTDDQLVSRGLSDSILDSVG